MGAEGHTALAGRPHVSSVAVEKQPGIGGGDRGGLGYGRDLRHDLAWMRMEVLWTVSLGSGVADWIPSRGVDPRQTSCCMAVVGLAG